MSQKSTYRPEIDGLRTVAIVPVVLVHMGFAWMSGGYVGVDVFFVISGYLISGVIIQKMNSDSWSFAGFWKARILRILPASVVMMLSVLVAAYFIMTPQHFVETSHSAMWQSVFLESVHLASQSHGYYDSTAQVKPLLHTWSLSIEELFYFLFPFALFFLWKRGRKLTIGVFALVALISLANSVIGSVVYPESTYYLLSARAWELLVGVLARVIVMRPNRITAQAMSLVGIVAIGYACIAYTDQTVFPGFAALIPTMGTAAILVSNQDHGTLVGRFLSMKPMVYVGKISYSLYLWHWPVYVFWKYYSLEAIGLSDQLLMICLSVVLALMSYYLIEKPFRYMLIDCRIPKIYGLGIGQVAAVASLGFLVTANAGWPERFETTSNIHKYYPDSSDDFDSKKIAEVKEILKQDKLVHLGKEGKPEFLVWCDSHGHPLREMISETASQQGLSGRIAMRSGSLPVPNVWTQRGSGQREFLAYNAAIEDYVYDSNIKHVILIGRWTPAVLGTENRTLSDTDRIPILKDSPQVLEKHLTALVDRLQSKGVTVWLMRQVPEHPFNPVEKLVATRGRIEGVTLAEHLMFQKETNEILLRSGATILDPTPYMFGENNRTILVGPDGIPEWLDGSHLNTLGAKRLKPLFNEVMEKIKTERYRDELSVQP